VFSFDNFSLSSLAAAFAFKAAPNSASYQDDEKNNRKQKKNNYMRCETKINGKRKRQTWWEKRRR